MKWRHHFYVDLALPFGLRSAPYIFNSIADLVEWILMNNHQIQILLSALTMLQSLRPFVIVLSYLSTLVSVWVLRRC